MLLTPPLAESTDQLAHNVHGVWGRGAVNEEKALFPARTRCFLYQNWCETASAQPEGLVKVSQSPQGRFKHRELVDKHQMQKTRDGSR